MCYSALVNQHSKRLGLTFKARIQIDAFEDLFTRRAKGGGEVIPPAMELAFLEDPSNAGEKKIAKLITEYRRERISEYEKLLFEQKKRVADAERALLKKVTKKAENDIRVGSDKVANCLSKIAELQKTKSESGFGRIFPKQYAPLVYSEGGKLWVAPFRFLLRPKGQDSNWDTWIGKGAFNARRDNLTGRNWKPIFKDHHGIIEVKRFWESVYQYRYYKQPVPRGWDDENEVWKDGDKKRKGPPKMEIVFDPKSEEILTTPCIYEFNNSDDLMSSFALITDDPNPEVLEAGHKRTPIFMKDSNIPGWMDVADKDFDRYFQILADKKKTYFNNEIVAA